MDTNHKPDSSRITEILRRAVRECFAAGVPDTSGTSSALDFTPREFFFSPEAAAIKAEIIRAGAKLWQRQYVDGNGGNLSVRVGEDYAICTPTLCSKSDLTPEDFSLVDLDNRQLCGSRPQTSEILLHLEIYKAQPAARAVIHCHPPYATAHALAGVIPQGNLIPEQEVFVGPVALAPYETPGTIEFARTILPFVKTHNTILLGSHGIVCWADSVTHAEWYVEVVETYCKTVQIASGIKTPLSEIPPQKIKDLLRRKRKMGLPDPRYASMLSADENAEKRSGSNSGKSKDGSRVRRAPDGKAAGGAPMEEEEIDRLTASFVSQFLSAMKTRA